MVKFYEEKIPTYPFIIWLGALFGAFLSVILLSQFTSRAVPISGELKILIAVLILLVLGTLVSFRALKIMVTEDRLIFGFGGWRKRIFLKNIEKIEIAKYRFNVYWGYGIRWGWDGSIGFIPRGGRGIKIWVKEKRWPYFIISNNPEELKRMIEIHR